MQINAQREAGEGGGEAQNLDPRVDVREDGGELVCRLAGNWTTRRVALVDKAMRAGVAPERISVSAHCTRHGPGRFHSHRAGQRGRQMGVLGIERID